MLVFNLLKVKWITVKDHRRRKSVNPPRSSSKISEPFKSSSQSNTCLKQAMQLVYLSLLCILLIKQHVGGIVCYVCDVDLHRGTSKGGPCFRPDSTTETRRGCSYCGIFAPNNSDQRELTLLGVHLNSSHLPSRVLHRKAFWIEGPYSKI